MYLDSRPIQLMGVLALYLREWLLMYQSKIFLLLHRFSFEIWFGVMTSDHIPLAITVISRSEKMMLSVSECIVPEGKSKNLSLSFRETLPEYIVNISFLLLRLISKLLTA